MTWAPCIASRIQLGLKVSEFIMTSDMSYEDSPHLGNAQVQVSIVVGER